MYSMSIMVLHIYYGTAYILWYSMYSMYIMIQGVKHGRHVLWSAGTQELTNP